MNKPSPEKHKFFKDHNADINTIVARENGRRSKRGLASLSDVEIDTTLDALMDVVSGGGRIRQYTFPETSNPIEPKPMDRIIPRKEIATPKTGNTFTIENCFNGFLLTVPGNPLPYVFKTENELFEILKEVVFVKLKAPNGTPKIFAESKEQGLS